MSQLYPIVALLNSSQENIFTTKLVLCRYQPQVLGFPQNYNFLQFRASVHRIYVFVTSEMILMQLHYYQFFTYYYY
jgi:hypothetical protein